MNPLPLVILIVLTATTGGVFALMRKASNGDHLRIERGADVAVSLQAHFYMPVPDPCKPTFEWPGIRLRTWPLEELKLGYLFQCGHPDTAPPPERIRLSGLIGNTRQRLREVMI